MLGWILSNKSTLTSETWSQKSVLQAKTRRKSWMNKHRTVPNDRMVTDTNGCPSLPQLGGAMFNVTTTRQQNVFIDSKIAQWCVNTRSLLVEFDASKVTRPRPWNQVIHKVVPDDWAALPSVPLHAVETHQQAIATEQHDPHKNVPAAT